MAELKCSGCGAPPVWAHKRAALCLECLRQAHDAYAPQARMLLAAGVLP